MAEHERIYNKDSHGCREVDKYVRRKGFRLTWDMSIIDKNHKVVGRVVGHTDGTQRILWRRGYGQTAS